MQSFARFPFALCASSSSAAPSDWVRMPLRCNPTKLQCSGRAPTILVPAPKSTISASLPSLSNSSRSAEVFSSTNAPSELKWTKLARIRTARRPLSVYQSARSSFFSSDALTWLFDIDDVGAAVLALSVREFQSRDHGDPAHRREILSTEVDHERLLVEDGNHAGELGRLRAQHV